MAVPAEGYRMLKCLFLGLSIVGALASTSVFGAEQCIPQPANGCPAGYAARQEAPNTKVEWYCCAIAADQAARCAPGLVWRERFTGDAVCVTPDQRYKLANGTCRSGYVWRDSFPGDGVCVTPAQRAQAKKKF
jgi:hypothetical protein